MCCVWWWIFLLFSLNATYIHTKKSSFWPDDSGENQPLLSSNLQRPSHTHLFNSHRVYEWNILELLENIPGDRTCFYISAFCVYSRRDRVPVVCWPFCVRQVFPSNRSSLLRYIYGSQWGEKARGCFIFFKRKRKSLKASVSGPKTLGKWGPG